MMGDSDPDTKKCTSQMMGVEEGGGGGGGDQPGPRRPRVLLGASGSVATIKLKELTREVSKFADVKVVATTKAAYHFVTKQELLEAGALEAYSDEDEWTAWKVMGNPVVHIELRKWADVFVIAPLSANSLGKLANGLSDNLLVCVLPSPAPSVLFPRFDESTPRPAWLEHGTSTVPSS